MSSSDHATAVERAGFSIAEFCLRHGISKPTYFKLKNAGLGPAEMRICNIIRISRQSELEWMRARTFPRGDELKARERAEAVAVEKSKKAGQAAVESDRHISKAGPRRTNAQRVK